MHGVNNISPSQTTKEYAAGSKPAETDASTEINIYADREAKEEIRELGRNDGGYDDREIDGDPDECIEQLENLKNRYEGKLSPDMIARIDSKIDNLRITKLANEIYNTDENQKLPPDKQRKALQAKLKSVKTPEDCIKLEKYFTEARNEWISMAGDTKVLEYYNILIDSIYTKHEQLDPKFNRMDSLAYILD